MRTNSQEQFEISCTSKQTPERPPKTVRTKALAAAASNVQQSRSRSPRVRSRSAMALVKEEGLRTREADGRARQPAQITVLQACSLNPRSRQYMDPSHRDDNLPARVSVLDVANCGGHLAQRKSALNHRRYLSSFAEFLQDQQVRLVRLH
jgi:hypothetical protein